MTKYEMNMVAQVMDGWHVGFVYLYSVNGGKRQEFVFDLLPENIASFIFRNQFEASRIEVTDMQGRMLLSIDSNGGEGNEDRELCGRVANSLQAILDGSELVQFPIAPKVLYEQYRALEERAVVETLITVLLKEGGIC